eukprot:4733322-Amphidinium_carterae.6
MECVGVRLVCYIAGRGCRLKVGRCHTVASSSRRCSIATLLAQGGWVGGRFIIDELEDVMHVVPKWFALLTEVTPAMVWSLTVEFSLMQQSEAKCVVLLNSGLYRLCNMSFVEVVGE